MPPPSVRSANAFGCELVFLAKLAEQGDVASRLVAEPEVLADHDGGRVQPVDQHGPHEFLGGQLGELLRERQHADRVRAEAAEQFDPVPRRAQQRRMRAWPHHLVGVRVKGDDDERQAQGAGDLRGPGHD